MEERRDRAESAMSTTDVVRIGQQPPAAEEDQGRLKAELQYLRRRALLKAPDLSYQGRKCAGCGAPFGRFYNTGASCSRCRHRVCRQCRIEVRGPANNKDCQWICNVCYKIAQLHAATGEWMYENLEAEESVGEKVALSPVDILKHSIRRAWTINGPPSRWSATRKSPELRIYRSLPTRHQNYREVIVGKIVEPESPQSKETNVAPKEDSFQGNFYPGNESNGESITKIASFNDRTKRDEKTTTKQEEEVPLVDSIKLKKPATRTKSEEDVREQSTGRVSLIKPPRILSKLISPEIKSGQAKHGDRKSNIPVFRRSSKEFEDIKSPQESSKRSLIPQRYRGSTDDLRRSREDISLPSLIPKLLSPRGKEERLKRQDSKDDVRPSCKGNRKDEGKVFKDESPGGNKSGIRIFRRDFSREDVGRENVNFNAWSPAKGKPCVEERVGESSTKSRPFEPNRSRISSRENKENAERELQDVFNDAQTKNLQEPTLKLESTFDRTDRSDKSWRNNFPDKVETVDATATVETFDRQEISQGNEDTVDFKLQEGQEVIDGMKTRDQVKLKSERDASELQSRDENERKISQGEEFQDKMVDSPMRGSTESLLDNADVDANASAGSGERKNLPDVGRRSDDFQVIRRKFSKEEFSNPDDTDDTPNKRCSSHLSPEASPLSTRSSRYSPRESESEPTPALPRKTAGDSCSASQRIRDAISRTRRESNSSARYESSGSESVRFSETGLHGYVELARKVKFFGGAGSGAIPSTIGCDEIVQRDSATSAGEDEPHDDCHGRPGPVSSQGRTMLRRRRQFDGQGSRRRGRSHARICCAEDLQSLQTLQVLGRGGRQASPTNNPGQAEHPIVDYRRLVFISSDSSSGREEDDADSSCSSSSYLNGLPRGGQSLEDCDWDYFESGTLPLPASVSCSVGPSNVASEVPQDWSCCPGRGSSACQACGGSRGANVLPVPVPIPVPVPYPVPVPAALWTGDFAAAASSMISRSAEAHSTELGALRLRGDAAAPWFAWHPRFSQPLHGTRFDPRLAASAFDPATCTFRPEAVVNARFYGSVVETPPVSATDFTRDGQEQSRAGREEEKDEAGAQEEPAKMKTNGGHEGNSREQQVKNVEDQQAVAPDEEKESQGKEGAGEEGENGHEDSLPSSFEGGPQRMYQRSREDSASSSGRSSADSSDLEEDSSSHRFSRVFVVNDDSLTSDNDIEDNGDEEDDSDSPAEGGVTLKRVTALPEEEPVVLQHIRFLNEDANLDETNDREKRSTTSNVQDEGEGESMRAKSSDQAERKRRSRNNALDDEKMPNDSRHVPEEMYLADDNDGSENPIELRSIKSLDPDSIEIVSKIVPQSPIHDTERSRIEDEETNDTHENLNVESLRMSKDDSGTELKCLHSSGVWDSTIIPDSLEIPELSKDLRSAAEVPIVRSSTPSTTRENSIPPGVNPECCETRARLSCTVVDESFNRREDNDCRDKPSGSALDSANLSLSSTSGNDTTTGSEVSSDELHEYEVNPSAGSFLGDDLFAVRNDLLARRLRRNSSREEEGKLESGAKGLRRVVEDGMINQDPQEKISVGSNVKIDSSAIRSKSRDISAGRAVDDSMSALNGKPAGREDLGEDIAKIFGNEEKDFEGAHDRGACPVRGDRPASTLVGGISERPVELRGGTAGGGNVAKRAQVNTEDVSNYDDDDASPGDTENYSIRSDGEDWRVPASIVKDEEIDRESCKRVFVDGEGVCKDVASDLRKEVTVDSAPEVNGDAEEARKCSSEAENVGRGVLASSSGKVEADVNGGGGAADGQGRHGVVGDGGGVGGEGGGEVSGDGPAGGSTRFRSAVERRPSTRKENGFPPAVPTKNPTRDAQQHFPSANSGLNNASNKYRSLVMITQEASYQPVSVITSDTTTLLQPDEVHTSSQGLAGYFQLALEAVAEQPHRRNGQAPRRPLMVKRLASSQQPEVEADSGLSVGSASESDDVSVKNASKANGQVLEVSKYDNHEENVPKERQSEGRARVSSQSSDENSASAGGVVILEEGLADDDSWVEEVSHDEDEPGATTATEESSEDEANNLGDREEELRGYHRQAIDFTLHTIVEESCEESEAEPSLAAGSPSKKQRPPSASELEKYFFFGLGDGNNSSIGSREVDSLSETSSIYSEGLESIGQDEGNGTPQGQDRSREEGFLNSSRLEKYFLSEFLGFDQDRRDSDGSVGSDSEGRPSPEAQRRKRLVRARGTGRSHSSSLDNLLALTQSSQNLSSQNSLQDLSLNQDGQETQSEGSSTETDVAEDGQTPVFGTDGQFDTVKRKKKKPRNLGTQSPRVPDDRNKTPEPSREMTLVGEVVVEADGEAINSEDSERAKTPQPESVLSSSSSTSNSVGSSNLSSAQNDSSRTVQGSSGEAANYAQRSKQQSRDSGFVGSCDDLLQHQKAPEDSQQNNDANQETARKDSGENRRTTKQGSNEFYSGGERGNHTKMDHPLNHTSLPHLPTASLSRKDSFNNWSSDEETNLMMSKMRQFFKTMVANSNGQGPTATSANSSAASPAPSPRLPGYSSKARLCAQNRTKPPQLVYFENELTRLMKTVPGIRDDQVREIVEYLSSEDTWSDSYDSSDYTSSDLEGGTAGGRRSALQEQISQSCQQIISKFDTASNDGLLTDKEKDDKNVTPGMQPAGLGRDTAFVYQKLVQSFTKMTGDGVSSDASSTPHSSPPLIAKVMHHIGSRLVALMHEVSEGGPAVQHHSTWRRYSQHHRTPSSASTTEDDDSTSDSTNPPPSSHLQLPRSKSHDPLLLINNHPAATAGQEGEEREASDYERFSWRGSFESALMAGDSRTKLSLLACSGDVSVGASASANALAMAAKRRSAGDLLFNPKSFSREQLDRVRSCGSIGGGGGGSGSGGVGPSGGSIEERIWSNRRRSSVPDANTRGESGASAGDEDTEDELEYGGESRATTLPRGMQSGIAAATNSLPRLPASTAPSAALAQSSATSSSSMHKAHSVYHFLPQHSGVKSARYRPPGFARNSNTSGPAGGPKRALSAPGLQVSGSQSSGKRDNSRSRRQQAMSLTPDDGSSLSEACSTPIIGAGSRASSSHTVMDMDDMDPGLHSGHLATRASLSSLGARSDSMASVYSGAGEGRCCRSVVVTGEVEFALQYDYKHLTFEVHVTKCKNLAPVDAKRKRSDPYVKVYLLPDKSKSGKRKTKVKKHTLNPEFNETLKFHMSLSGLETRTLWLTVWHSDMFGRNDFLGEVRMPLENKIFDDPTPRWYPLQERTEPFDDPVAYKGEVIVGLKFVPPDPAQQERDREMGSDNRGKTRKNWSRGALHVLVKEARNLQTRGKNSGTCDPFCKSYLLPDKGRSGKQKTGVVRRSGGSPVWGHTFIYKDVSLQELAERGLELTVWDHDRIASNEFLGGVRFNLGTGKHYGKPVDWMDATGRELSLWQNMLERPNFWVEGAVTLRPNLHSHGKNNG